MTQQRPLSSTLSCPPSPLLPTITITKQDICYDYYQALKPNIQSDDSRTIANLQFMEDIKENGETVQYTQLLCCLVRCLHENRDQIRLAKRLLFNINGYATEMIWYELIYRTDLLCRNVIEQFESHYASSIQPVQRRIPSTTPDRAAYPLIPTSTRRLVHQALGVVRFVSIYAFNIYNSALGIQITQDTSYSQSGFNDQLLSLRIAWTIMEAFEMFSQKRYYEAAERFAVVAATCTSKQKAKHARRFSTVCLAYHHEYVETQYTRALIYCTTAEQLGWERDALLVERLRFAKSNTALSQHEELDARETRTFATLEDITYSLDTIVGANPFNIHTFNFKPTI